VGDLSPPKTHNSGGANAHISPSRGAGSHPGTSGQALQPGAGRTRCLKPSPSPRLALSWVPLTREDVVESRLHVGGVQSRRLEEGQPVLFCKDRVSSGGCRELQPPRGGTEGGDTCKAPGLVGGHGPQVPQVALVAHQHDDDVGISVVLQLLQPALGVLVRQVLGDVVDEQSSHRSPVVPGGRRGDGVTAGPRGEGRGWGARGLTLR